MIEFSDIQTTVVVLIALAGVIVLIDKLVDIAKKMKKPSDDVASRLDRHEEHLRNNHDRLKNQEEATKLLVRGMSLLMSHEIDGNHVDRLKEASDDMNRFLIDRM